MYSALSLAESVDSNSTALRLSAYFTPASKAALNNSASCLSFFMDLSSRIGSTSRVFEHLDRRLDAISRYEQLHSCGSTFHPDANTHDDRGDALGLQRNPRQIRIDRRWV